VNPLFTGLLVTLNPVPVSFLHAERAVLIIGVVLVAFHAEDVGSITAILLGFEFGRAHPALEAALTGVLLLVEGFLADALQFAADGMIHILAGDALDEAVLDGHLALNAGCTLRTVPQLLLVLSLIDIQRNSHCVRL
jgi:hypothetical protein